MRTNRARLLLSAVSTILAYGATPAFANDPATPAVPSDPATPAATIGTGDIIVTARRHAERITDVPVAISVISGPALISKGIEQVADLQSSTPSMKAAPASGRASNTQYEIRGITTIESLITEDPAVGIYVDDVYRARPTGTNQSFYDIANVQVLYGPQGTLFGRNSTGGAVLISSAHPTDRLEGSLEAGYGNLNNEKFTGMLNVPLADNLQVRIAGQHTHEDGYVHDLSNGTRQGGHDDWGGRISVHYKPAPNIDNLLIASIYSANDEGSANEIYGVRTSSTPNAFGQVPYTGLIPSFGALASFALAQQQAAGAYKTYSGASSGAPGAGYYLEGTTLQNTGNYERPRTWSISNTTTIDLGGELSLKNIFGYNHVSLNTSTDLDGTAYDLIDTYYATRNNQVSDEVQLSGRSSSFNWVVGGMYFQERGSDVQPAVQFFSNFQNSDLSGVNTSEGIFAQGTYKLTPKLSLTAGGRYTWDQRDATFSNMLVNTVPVNSEVSGTNLAQVGVNAVCALPSTLPGYNAATCGVAEHKTFAEPSYTVSLDYKPDRDTLLYIAHRHGYRAGGFNSRLSITTAGIEAATPASQAAYLNTLNSQITPFKPEKVNDLEIGFKGSFDVGTVKTRLSVALYDSWYTNILKQVTAFSGGQGVTLITNAGSANVKGAEATFGVSPIREISLDGYASYTDGKYKNFTNPDATPGASPTVPVVPFTTSKWSAGATLTLTPIDGPQGRVSLATTYSYRSSYYGDNALPAVDAEAHIPAQGNLNMNLSWDKIANSNFSASVWAHNLTNEVHYLGLIDLIPTFGIAVAVVGEPRTYGFSIKYKF